MTFFTNDTVKFWKGLAKNNNKAWFDKNRKAYEQHLKEPYARLASALVEQVSEVEPEYNTPPKQAMYRINRDIRFAADKTPYKTRLGVTMALCLTTLVSGISGSGTTMQDVGACLAE